MAKIELLACDVCGGHDALLDVGKYLVERVRGDKGEADLCREHAAPLESYIAAHPARTRRRGPLQVMAVEDIPKRAREGSA